MVFWGILNNAQAPTTNDKHTPSNLALSQFSPIETCFKRMSETIFEKIVSGKIPSYKLYEDAHVIAILDIFPAAKVREFLMLHAVL